MVLYPVLAAIIIMTASLSGILFVSRKLGTWTERNLPYLATFSIGIFAVITWGLFEESFEHGSLSIALISAAAGALIIQILSLIIPDAHHHHDPHPTHSHSQIDAKKVLLGDALHNISDGLLLVPAFLADVKIGIVTTIGIFIHEFVQEVSEFFIYKEAGYTTKQALVRNFIAAGTIFIGIGLSIAVSSVESLEAPLIGIAAGGFLYILLRDLVPHTIHSVHEKGRGDLHIKALVLGVLIMIGVNNLLPHGHEEIEETHELPGIETNLKKQ